MIDMQEKHEVDKNRGIASNKRKSLFSKSGTKQWQESSESIIISHKMFGKVVQKTIEVVTLGKVIANLQTGAVTFKDPVTGLWNMIAGAKDALFHDFSKGVWVGKRPIANTVGFSSFLLENHNLNPMHYGVRVDGQSWHLSGVNGSNSAGIEVGGPDKIITVLKMKEHEIDGFKWFYKGETVNPVEPLVQAINQQKFVYDMPATNCVVVAKSLWYYARGLISIPEAIAQIKFAILNLVSNLAHGAPSQNFALEMKNLFT